MCTPSSSTAALACRRSIAVWASRSVRPNFESVWPVEILSCVSPRTPGVTRSEHRLWLTAVLRDDLLEPVDLVEVVDHDVADADRARRAQLLERLGVAVHVDAAAGEAGAQRQRQLAAARDVAAEALLAQSTRRRRCTGTPWTRTRPRSRRCAPRRRRRTRGRGRAGRPRRRRRRACRTRAPARARRSRPSSRRPASLIRLPSGIDRRELLQGRHRRRIMPRHAHRQRGAAGRDRRARRPRVRAVPACERARRGGRGAPRRGLVQGVALRLRRAPAAADGLAALCFDMRGHGESDGADGRPRAGRRRRDGGAARDAPASTRRAARLVHGRLPRARGGRARRARAPSWRSARRAREACARGLRAGRFEFAADTATLERAARRARRAAGRRAARRAAAAAARRGRRGRPGRALPSAPTSQRPARASSRCRAATTARSSTTPSCRRWRRGSSATW